MRVSYSHFELFAYDNLNRLTEIEYYDNGTLVSAATMNIGYGDDGNIISKFIISKTCLSNEGSSPMR
ncbi:MAG TPA: hypothetical protein VJ951_02340 [Bacteroidales bacterium]|nr:hypothetical protein [Bacteroidales bacterium]